MSLGPFGFWLVSMLCIAVAGFTKPHRASCPPHFWANGIRPSGEFSCLRTLERESDVPADAEIHSRLYCNGTIPVVVSERAVRCRSW